jgi:hypothetical protein
MLVGIKSSTRARVAARMSVGCSRCEPDTIQLPSAWAVPYELDVPSVWAVSQQTPELVDHGVAPRVIPVKRRTQNSS